MERLSDTWRDHRAPHLVTVLDGRAHVVPAGVDAVGHAFRVDAPGRRTRAAVSRQAEVTLVWAPPVDGGYSLIVDGRAVVDGDALLVSPTRAVRHRGGVPAAPGDGACGSDCVELDPSLP